MGDQKRIISSFSVLQKARQAVAPVSTNESVLGLHGGFFMCNKEGFCLSSRFINRLMIIFLLLMCDVCVFQRRADVGWRRGAHVVCARGLPRATLPAAAYRPAQPWYVFIPPLYPQEC
jgi:hypothetical protein